MKPRYADRYANYDIDYSTRFSSYAQAFPPGEFFTVPVLPNVTAVNALGDFHIAADRIAFIDGEGKWQL